MDLEQMWQSTLGEMEVQLTKAHFATWLKNSRPLDKKDDTLFVALPSNFAKNWVEEKYQKNIIGIVRNMDTSVKKIEFVVGNKGFPVPKPSSEHKEAQAVTEAELDFNKTDPETGLNPKYTLASFVVGPSNELAFAAATAVTEDPGRKYNPFFIYGGVGLGKTHLIQAIGNELITKFKGKIKPKYVSSEQFTRDIVWGLRNDRIESVKKKYRDVDVLIIDDIQFIGGKEKTEEEFFHTFNALYENNKQIIISSDRPPQSLPTLEERLRSRFEGGLIADVSYPEYEMRVAIIRSKLQEMNRRLPDPVVDLIAKRLRKNIRELEGVLKKIVFYEERKQAEISIKMAEEIIEKATQNLTKRVSDVQILKSVAEFFNIAVEDLVSHNRRKEVVEPRQIAIYLLRDISELSYPYIGEKLGRDHTTAIHSYEKINQEINRNPALNQKILTIKDMIYKS
ncbi:MAG TPA: chromosomal replication initiator protein DnaA [Candidatus Paceibacterota bacterium]|nr:chromosomal replication initiator protein DnaA [Candidatus Paceibacterota bacterium]